MIKLRVDDETAIPLSVDSSSAVSMTVSEAFIDRGGSAIQNNKNATPSTSQVVVTPDQGFDGMAKVTVEAMPQGALSPIDIDFDVSTGAFTAEARVGTSGYLADTERVGGGFQLATQAAAVITPIQSAQRQAVAAHKYTTGAVVVDPIPPEYIIPSGTKNITANGNAQDVKAYEKVNVSVPNSYAASDEGKVVSSGALVAQTSQTIDENGTYDTTTKNEVVVDVSGSSGKVLLASETATEDVSVMTISYDSETMSGYTYFEMEIEGVATSAKLLYPCPQINITNNKAYNGYVSANAAFHFYAPVVPYYSSNSHNIQGYRVSIGGGTTQQVVNGNTISSFSYASYYPEGGFRSGTVFKVWGIPT